jgi:hypothetical protein
MKFNVIVADCPWSFKVNIREVLENCPSDVKVNPELQGYWIDNDQFICANCAARLVARGCGNFSVKKVAVWKDDPYGVCCGCGEI